MEDGSEKELQTVIERTQQTIRYENLSTGKRQCLYETLDEWIVRLGEIRRCDVEQQKKKIKNYFAEANEGDPKHVKQLTTSVRPKIELKEIVNSENNTVNDHNLNLDETLSFYKNSYKKEAATNNKIAIRDKYLDKFFESNKEKLDKFYKPNGKSDLDPDEIRELEFEQTL